MNIDVDSAKANSEILRTEAAKEIQTSKPQVLPMVKNRKSFIKQVLIILVAFLIPTLIMGIITNSAIDYYVEMTTLNISNEKVSAVQDVVKTEEEKLAEEKAAKSFRSVLKNYIYGNTAFNSGIIRGVINDWDDVRVSVNKSSSVSNALSEHFDPFYVLNKQVAKGDKALNSYDQNTPLYERMMTNTFKLLVLEYVLRFGLASLAMFCFAAFGMRLNSSKSLIVGIIYSLSSLVVLFAQNSSIMNLIVVLPLVMWAVVRYQYNTSVYTALILAVMVAIMSVTGIYGVLFGTVFVIVFLLYIGIFTAKNFKRNLQVSALGTVSVFAGLMLSIPVWLSYIKDLKITSVIPEAFEEASMRYTFVDFLYRFCPLSKYNLSYDSSVTSIPKGALSITKIYNTGSLGSTAVDTNLSMVPPMYMSVLALVLIVCFFLNKRVPVAARISAFVLVFIYNLSYSFVPLDAMTNLFDMGTVLGSVRFVFIHAFLCFLIIVALGLFDFSSSSVKLATILLVSVSIVFTALFDGAYPTSVKMLMCVALPLIYYFVFTRFNSSRYLLPILTVLLICEVFIVTDIIYKTNSVPVNYLNNPLVSSNDETLVDRSGVEDIMLLGTGGSNSFTTFSYTETIPQNILEAINAIYSERFDDSFVKEMMPVTMYTECMDKVDGVFTISESDYAKLIASFDGKQLDENSRIIFYSDYPEKCHWMITNIDASGFLERGATENGPFIRDITDEVDDIYSIIENFGLQVEVDLMNNEGSTSFSMGFFVIDGTKVEKYNSLFDSEMEGLDGSSIVRVITDYDYCEDLRVSIDLRNYDTYDFCGKIAFDADSAELNGKTIRISDSGGIQLGSVVLEVMAWFIALTLIFKTRQIKEVASKEEESNIQNA